MAIKLIHSLKFQITAAMIILLSLFSFSIAFTLYTIQERETETATLQLINRLQLITNYMEVQSLNYLNNRGISINRSEVEQDNNWYIKELRGQLNNKNEIISCFADQHLLPELIDRKQGVDLSLNKKTRDMLVNLQQLWNGYYRELQQKLDNTNSSPQLIAAAKYIAEHQNNIKTVEDDVVRQLQQDINKRIKWINSVNKVILAISFLVAFVTLLGFYIKVIMPLNQAVAGFNKVASGEFGHQVVVKTNNEVSSITRSFNHLSQRLSSIFNLIERIQQGSDLDTTLAFIAEEFSSILPMNWVSALLHKGNATMLELQGVYVDGSSLVLSRTLFSLKGTLLEKAMLNKKPLLIDNLDETAKKNKHYVFLNMLAKAGMKSAIFLHLSQTTQVPGMLVFASRQPDAYNEEHIELLSNIASLVTHSFGKTIKMAEQKQLAAIGEFTSGIVHEVRNPLTTIGLALKYFSQLNLDEDGKEWAEISMRESERMKRLLEDVLLYAKPVKLILKEIYLPGFINSFIKHNSKMGEKRNILFGVNFSEVTEKNAWVNADNDRLNQIFLNIYQNAIDASNKGSMVSCNLIINHEAHTISIVINNQGEPIDKEILNKIGEPFFTTKPRGTGLGMGIVKRMVEAHSGHLIIESSQKQGTDVVIILPLISQIS